jgi:hypothetical protein
LGTKPISLLAWKSLPHQYIFAGKENIPYDDLFNLSCQSTHNLFFFFWHGKKQKHQILKGNLTK